MSGHDYAEANKHHHNRPEHLKEHIQPWTIWGSGKATESILKAYTFNKESTTVLDFACGAGMVARGLAPFCARIVGVDISSNMVDAFNRLNMEAGLDRDNFHAVQRDSLRDADDELDGELFDVVVVSQVLHHVDDIPSLLRALSRRLKSDGQLLIIDHYMSDHWATRSLDDPSLKAIDKVVAHKHGFTSEELKTLLVDVGCFSSVSVKLSHEATMGELAKLGGAANPASTLPAHVTMTWWIARCAKL